MDQDPFKRAAEEFKRSRQEHVRRIGQEMERAHKEIHSAMARVRADMERLRADFERGINEAREHMNWTGWDDPLRPDRGSPKGRRPRRKRPGGEPAPVKPKPKPTPLVDGAEVPID